MITILFLVIAFFRRKRFLPENAFWVDKVSYYVLNVALTPVFGPRVYLWLNENVADSGDARHSDGCAMMPPNAFM